jgi:hypothetical protein
MEFNNFSNVMQMLTYELAEKPRKTKQNVKSQFTTYKNNSGLIAKPKVSKPKKGLCLTKKFTFQNPPLFFY